jgi:membrane protein
MAKDRPRDKANTDVGWWSLLQAAGNQWWSHNDARLGAALAFYSIFSVGPLITLICVIAGLVFGQETVRSNVLATLASILGDTGSQVVNTMMAAASRPEKGWLATLIGSATLMLAALGVVVQLKDAMNTVWEVPSDPTAGVLDFLRTYVASLASLLALAFLLLTSLLVTAALAAGNQALTSFLPASLLEAANFVLSLGVVSALFALLFKGLPDAKVAWSDVWIGAIGTACLFEIGKTVIGFYIGTQHLEAIYGTAASLVVALLWVYYSAQIVLLGAEFTRVYAERRGSLSSRPDHQLRRAA